MLIREIIAELTSAKLLLSCTTRSQDDIAVILVTTDSRKAKSADHLFIAYKGISVDGHDFITKCYESGVRLFVVESLPTTTPNDALFLVVSSARHAWSYVCALQFGNPERQLTFCGITGTNGKTSTAWFLHHLLIKQGLASAYIGTLGTLAAGKLVAAKHTTPDPPDLFETLAKFVSSGIKFVCIEASSQSIVHGRLGPIRFSAAGFTSFSHDHLDTHGSMENYLHAKLEMFEDYLLPQSRVVACEKLRETLKDSIFFNDSSFEKSLLWYGLGSNSNLSNSVSCHVSGRRVSGCDIEIRSNDAASSASVAIVGDVFVENFVCALLLSQSLTHSPVPTAMWGEIPLVPGRCEVVQAKHRSDRPTVIVDYAHTPDGLENVLKNLRAFCAGKLICVFGCGGDRDPLKRPIMGKIASELSDIVYVTSDNPRTENPDTILSQITAGISASHFGSNIHVEVKRELAIARAIQGARSDDLVLVAGKGHENYQIIGTNKIHFDDREISLAELNK
jgi:UDP-N-acetylmuramoyl-L-alanyl-D-glutamate--2,6-diaminopimelate ligase